VGWRLVLYEPSGRLSRAVFATGLGVFNWLGKWCHWMQGGVHLWNVYPARPAKHKHERQVYVTAKKFALPSPAWVAELRFVRGGFSISNDFPRDSCSVRYLVYIMARDE